MTKGKIPVFAGMAKEKPRRAAGLRSGTGAPGRGEKSFALRRSFKAMRLFQRSKGEKFFASTSPLNRCGTL